MSLLNASLSHAVHPSSIVCTSCLQTFLLTELDYSIPERHCSITLLPGFFFGNVLAKKPGMQ